MSSCLKIAAVSATVWSAKRCSTLPSKARTFSSSPTQLLIADGVMLSLTCQV
jgi:hypothetical protein